MSPGTHTLDGTNEPRIKFPNDCPSCGLNHRSKVCPRCADTSEFDTGWASRYNDSTWEGEFTEAVETTITVPAAAIFGAHSLVTVGLGGAQMETWLQRRKREQDSEQRRREQADTDDAFTTAVIMGAVLSDALTESQVEYPASTMESTPDTFSGGDFGGGGAGGSFDIDSFGSDVSVDVGGLD